MALVRLCNSEDGGLAIDTLGGYVDVHSKNVASIGRRFVVSDKNNEDLDMQTMAFATQIDAHVAPRPELWGANAYRRLQENWMGVQGLVLVQMYIIPGFYLDRARGLEDAYMQRAIDDERG